MKKKIRVVSEKEIRDSIEIRKNMKNSFSLSERNSALEKHRRK